MKKRSTKNGAAEAKKLNIGLVFDDSLDIHDGVAQYVKTLGRWLSSEGHEVSYLVGETKAKNWSGGRIYSLSRNLRVIFNGNRLSMPLPSSKRRIARLVREKKFDVIHVQVPYSPFMAKHVINAASRHSAVIGTFHILPAGWAAKWGSRLLPLTYGRSLRRFDRMYGVSPAAARFAKESLSMPVDVSPDVIELAELKRQAGVASRRNGPKIIFLGRLVKRKGSAELIKAFSLVHQQVPEAKLIIAGAGPQRKNLEQMVSGLNLGDSVVFKGFVPENDKIKLLASADLACFPSLGGESFGIVLLEAMAAGNCVVLGGDNPGYRDVLDGRDESLINARDTSAFAARITKLLTDKKLRADLLAWQKSHVKNFDVKIVGPELLKTYRQVIAKKKPNKHNKE